jgi:hypothetical protein
MTKMAKAMHEVTIGNFNKFLKRIDHALGMPRVFVATVDTVTEQHRTCQLVGVLMFDKGEVKVAFVDYILAKDCKGKGLADELIQTCIRDTLRFKREERAQQVVGLQLMVNISLTMLLRKSRSKCYQKQSETTLHMCNE